MPDVLLERCGGRVESAAELRWVSCASIVLLERYSGRVERERLFGLGRPSDGGGVAAAA